MADAIKGTCVVEVVTQKKGIYYIKGGDDKWYSCYKTKPDCDKGDEITFDYKVNGDFNNVVKGSIEVIGHTDAAEQPSGEEANSSSGGGYTPSKSNNVYDNASYWKAKTDQDMLVTQHEIRYAAARKCASDTILAALEKGIIELPKEGTGKKKGNQLEAIANNINQLTDDFCEACREYVDMQNQEAPEED